MRVQWMGSICAAALLLAGPALAQAPGAGALGLFDAQGDVGVASTPGTGAYDPATGVYTITSAGENTWARTDAFHFLWKTLSGDVALSAEIRFPPITNGHAPSPNRKGFVMIRQSLDPGSAYADAAVHGGGVTALQYRPERGAETQDVELDISAPLQVRIEKRGDVLTLWTGAPGQPLRPNGVITRLKLDQPFYVGIGALSHDVTTTETIQFANVQLTPLAPLADAVPKVQVSTLELTQTEDKFRRASLVRSITGYIQSPNPAPDGKSVYAHDSGHIVRIPRLGPNSWGAPQPVDMGGLVGCSGNFGLSPDGKWLAVSCATVHGAPHQVFLLAAGGGGSPKPVTDPKVSSYFHAWSPDSQVVAFTRGQASKADIFTVAIAGGPEHRLTSDTLNDGPDFTPDGQFIYFDSLRSGSLQIWRMRRDGTGAEQLTDDGNFNSSPHVSPDGKQVSFLCQPAAVGFGRGPATLKILQVEDGLIRPVVSFEGDRGSVQMYDWADNDHLAFVGYRQAPADDAPPL